MLPLLACLAVLLCLGVVERRARDRAWRAVPIRIHVNGTRGKSTVTRLIWSALREAGVPALAKTTGTAPRLLLPDGTERAVPRRAPASIREQLALLRLARRLGARAVVAECMAIDPELQWISEHEMVRATVGVITNVRPDHTEVMGEHLEQVAASLANTTPVNTVLVFGESSHCTPIAARATAMGTRLIAVAEGDGDAGWLRENERTSLAVTRHLGISDEVAVRGFALAPSDPGSVKTGKWGTGELAGRWIDATAANDPVSLAMLLEEERRARPGTSAVAGNNRRLTAIYNHRADRAARLSCFANHGTVLALADSLIVTGDRFPLSIRRRLRNVRGGRKVSFVPRRALASWLVAHAQGDQLIFCGNTRGIEVAAVITEATRRG